MIRFKPPVTRCAAILILSAMMVLTGCTKAPDNYLKAAERYSKSLCEGIIESVWYSLFNYSGVDNSEFSYRCIDSEGTSVHSVPFAEIPVDYFEEKH